MTEIFGCNLQVDQTLDFFGTLKSQHHEVAAKTRQLHDNCQQLVRPDMWRLLNVVCGIS
jgi:hypothetical protein